jgi:hypothetical protein
MNPFQTTALAIAVLQLRFQSSCTHMYIPVEIAIAPGSVCARNV